jgi:hypothetical protein
MEFRHGCSFCGWSRSSDTPVMLSPNCERCGCSLDAFEVRGDAVPAAPVRRPIVPARAGTALHALGLLFGALTLFAAAKLGYRLAGPSGGLISFGAAGFLMLPFVPERVG